MVRASRLLRAVCTGVACAWVVLLLLTPRWASLADPGVPDGPSTVAALVWMAGSRVCHQRPARSFHLHGRPMPVCGRCTGLYVTGAVGLVAGVRPRRRRRAAPIVPSAPSWRLGGVQRWVSGRVSPDPRAGWLAVASLPTLLTWTLEVAGLWNPGTPLRALAAVPLGLTAGWLMARALDD